MSFRNLVLALTLSAIAGGVHSNAQSSVRYNAGQNVAPIFEGWLRNPDGTFTMAFGYLNRNYVEHVVAPVGPANNFAPAGPDRGQPEHFYPRLNRYVFTVTVPRDWGRKELVWTLTVHGKTEKAVGWLQPEWEIDRKVELAITGRGSTFDSDEIIFKNQPPAVRISAGAPATLSQALQLTASLSDDGLPPPGKPRQQRLAVGQETPPTLQGGGDSPVNVAVPPNRPPLPPRGRLTVKWITFRGPAPVVFSPSGFADVKDGQVATEARFTEPGSYILRALGSDGMLVTNQDVGVTVAR